MAQRLTDHGDGADSCASAGGVLHIDAVSAAVFSLGLADVEAEVVGGAVGADFLIRLQLLVVLLPGDSRSRFAAVASRQCAGVSYLHHHLVPEVQVQSGRFWGVRQTNSSGFKLFFFLVHSVLLVFNGMYVMF